MASIRALSRNAIKLDPKLRFVEVRVDGKLATHFPAHYSCFAFECILKPETMKAHLDEEVSSRNLAIGQGVDMLLTLDSLALWVFDGGMNGRSAGLWTWRNRARNG
jgi:hypothetical protein